MSVYQINYDLRKKRDYQPLYDKLESYNGWCRPLESCYLICSNDPISQILNNLTQVIDKDDGIFVTQLTGLAGWEGLSKQAGEWIKKHL